MGIAERLWLAVDESEEDVATNGDRGSDGEHRHESQEPSLEGKKLCGDSFIDFSNEIDDIEEEDEEGRR